ncbi:MAG: hypothetical protein KKH98_00355 [Spirochaetes bacterium]|nr:hypothetical protein [Spirochaetota bacterium]
MNSKYSLEASGMSFGLIRTFPESLEGFLLAEELMVLKLAIANVYAQSTRWYYLKLYSIYGCSFYKTKHILERMKLFGFFKKRESRGKAKFLWVLDPHFVLTVGEDCLEKIRRIKCHY